MRLRLLYLGSPARYEVLWKLFTGFCGGRAGGEKGLRLGWGGACGNTGVDYVLPVDGLLARCAVFCLERAPIVALEGAIFTRSSEGDIELLGEVIYNVRCQGDVVITRGRLGTDGNGGWFFCAGGGGL